MGLYFFPATRPQSIQSCLNAAPGRAINRLRLNSHAQHQAKTAPAMRNYRWQCRRMEPSLSALQCHAQTRMHASLQATTESRCMPRSSRNLAGLSYYTSGTFLPGSWSNRLKDGGLWCLPYRPPRREWRLAIEAEAAVYPRP